MGQGHIGRGFRNSDQGERFSPAIGKLGLYITNGLKHRSAFWSACGDKFYHANGDVTHADTNAALNIKQRGDDTDITLYTPYREVKKILLARLSANGGVSSSNTCDRPSMTLVAHEKSASTESELLRNLQI